MPILLDNKTKRPRRLNILTGSMEVNLKVPKLVLILIATSVLGACASLKTSDPSGDAALSEGGGHSPRITSFRLTDVQPPELEVPEFNDIPERAKPLVNKWLNYFQGKGRVHMERYLSRSSRYSVLMKKILRDNGLPEDLIYVALIESGFSPKAVSSAAAVGYWQFIRGTGKRYGLEISGFMDERRDPELATQAASDYLKGLYEEFDSWFLAMASYNVGEGRVRREIARTKSRDFWELARRRRLPRETINYVPKFLAARMIGRNPEKYGFVDLAFEPNIEFETVVLTAPVNLKTLAEGMDTDYAELKRLNPKYRGEIAPLDGGKIELRIPLGSTQAALMAVEKAKVEGPVVFVADVGERDVYKIRRGDTLSKIAKKFKTSVASIRDMNNFNKKTKLKPGRTIFIPLVEDQKLITFAKKQEEELLAQDQKVYILKTGDTLLQVASRFGMTVEELKEMNQINDGDLLKVGTRLVISDAARQVAGEAPTGLNENRLVQPVNQAAKEGVPALETEAKQVEAQMEPVNGSQVVKNSLASNSAASSSSKNLTDALQAQEPKASGQGVQATKVIHKVKRGENLTLIAKKYGVSVQEIKKANKIARKNVLHVGTKLVIPAPENENQLDSSRVQLKSKQLARVTSAKPKKSKPKREANNRRHIVKRGETLTDISKRYSVSMDSLIEANKIKRSNHLFVGASLVIPQSEARVKE